MRRAFHPLVVALAVSLAPILAACGGEDDPGPDDGAGTARGVVDLHIEASRRYDLAATCQLFTPAKRAEMAAFDEIDVDDYCEKATRPIVDAADDDTRERTRRIYTDPKVAEIDRPGGTWFSIEAADGSYHEDVETVEVDGRWWIAQVESDVDTDDHDH